MSALVDARRDALQAWANEQLKAVADWQPVSVDASARRYFRGRPSANGRSWIAVDAPPEREDSARFVRVAELMAAAGLNVPRIKAADLDAGFLLVSDLGERTYLDVLDADNADALFGAATGALIDLQQASRPGVLPDYDRAFLAAELSLFADWYLARHLDYCPTAAERTDIDAAFDFILDNVCAQPQVYVHRDFMPRNLMLSQPLPGVLDFQDARYGPVGYDAASLFRDAFISWPAARVDAWLGQYWEAARARGVPVGHDWQIFQRNVALAGAQRHIKILGGFARTAYRDGKPRYLADAPRFIDYLRPVVAEFEALEPLAPLLARQVAGKPT